LDNALPPADNVGLLLHLLLEQVEFFCLKGDARVPHGPQNLAQVFDMLCGRLLEDDDVFQVHEAALPPVFPQDHVYGPLEGLRGVRQAKRAAHIVVSPLVASEGRPVAVLGGQRYVLIPLVAVQR